LGNLLATSPLVLLVQALGWRGAFMVFSAMSFALSAAVYALVRDAPPEDAGLQIPAGGSRASAEPPLPLVQVARLLFVRRDYWLISLGTFFRYGTFVSIQGLWAGPFLMESVGLSAMQAGNVLVLLNLGMIAGSPIGGLLSDRVLNSRKIVVMTGLAGLATATLLLSRAWAGERVAVLCVLFFMIGVSNAFGSIMYAHIKELMPTAMSGSALTGINVFTMAGAAVFLQGMGSVIARWPGADGGSGYRTAFLLAGLTILGAFALYSASKDAKPASGR
jgi:predicted MFS family arabinose efflux permease